MSTTNVTIFKIQNLYLWSVILKFWNPNDAFETAELWYNVHLTTILKEKAHFFLICIFYCGLVEKGWSLKVAVQFAVRGLVAYKPVAY